MREAGTNAEVGQLTAWWQGCGPQEPAGVTQTMKFPTALFPSSVDELGFLPVLTALEPEAITCLGREAYYWLPRVFTSLIALKSVFIPKSGVQTFMEHIYEAFDGSLILLLM